MMKRTDAPHLPAHRQKATRRCSVEQVEDDKHFTVFSLAGANLARGNFRNTNLDFADLSNANMNRSTLRGGAH
jgi:uncharacterized protein YjbI with pentapeptide repeats